MNGNLALSRAIGDFEFKKSAELAPEQQIVTAYPDVVVHDMGDDDEFLVIACDGKSSRALSLSPLSSFMSLTDELYCRHLGLPVLASRYRVCQARNRRPPRFGENLREYDGQLSRF